MDGNREGGAPGDRGTGSARRVGGGRRGRVARNAGRGLASPGRGSRSEKLVQGDRAAEGASPREAEARPGSPGDGVGRGGWAGGRRAEAVPEPGGTQGAGTSWRPPEGQAWGLPRVGRVPAVVPGVLRGQAEPGLPERPPPGPRPPPTYAGRHIDEVEQRGREREEEERGEQRAARQPQQPPADAHAAAGPPRLGRAGPAPAAPRAPPPGPRPPARGPRWPPLAAAASLPAARRRGPGHMKRAGAGAARASAAARRGGGRGGRRAAGGAGPGAGPAPDAVAPARRPPPGPAGNAAAWRSPLARLRGPRSSAGVDARGRPGPGARQPTAAPSCGGRAGIIGTRAPWSPSFIPSFLPSFTGLPRVERPTYARHCSWCCGCCREQNGQNLRFLATCVQMGGEKETYRFIISDTDK